MPSLVARLISGITSDPLILPLASGLLASHALLTLFISKILPFDGPWKKTAIFTTKQLLGFVMMVYQTYYGFRYWTQAEYSNPPSKLVEDEKDLFLGGVLMSRVVLGALLHDIPAGFASGSVDTMMHVHHFGMFLVASISLGLWAPDGDVPVFARYAPFFFGVIEISSIPLVFVDMFHPHKQPEWHQYHLGSSFLQTLNEICRNSFAVLYILARLFYFPKVVFGQLLPDAYLKWSQPENTEHRLPIAIIAIFSLCFTALQMYWGSLILKQIAKALKGDDKEEASQATGEKKKPKIKAV